MILVVAAIIVDRLPNPTQVLAARRRDEPRGWEFPGGKVEPGEDPVPALRRELAEELDIRVRVGAELPSSDGKPWPISARYVLRAWFATLDGAAPQPGPDHDDVRWLSAQTLDEVDWLPVDRAVVAALRRNLGWPNGSRGSG